AELKRFARYYMRIKNKDAPEIELTQAFTRFAFLDAETAIPFILHLYERYENKKVKNPILLPTFVSMLDAMESFVLRRSILRWRTNGYGLDFATAISKSDTFQQLGQYFVNRGWPTDDEVAEALLRFEIGKREEKKAKLILFEVERGFGHREKVSPDNLTLEHILPRIPSAAWRTMLGEQTDRINSQYGETLGNLSLSGDNSAMGNQGFEKKREFFRKSKLDLNRYIAAMDVWTQEEIIERTKMLTAHFIRIWQRPAIDQSETDEGPPLVQTNLW
ncbi:MAG: HNH endonuclease family protein, partial [Candidatus Methanoperedens sp.]|nr:HNH endonuclease family protein [Candidatus Methanoperedens sp.]